MPTKEEIQHKVENGELTVEEIIANGWMCSVTKRIEKIKQPRGGYIRPRDFEKISLGSGIEELHPTENINPGLVGSAVDYLTRYMTGTPIRDAFAVSIKGAAMLNEFGRLNILLVSVDGLDDDSIDAAVKLTGYDCAFRAGIGTYRPVEDIEPNTATIENIRIMVERSLHFFERFGPKVLDGLIFEGGYTGYVSHGDGDFLTKDTIWDFKVSKQKVQTKHTLQLLMYWRMGLHSVHPEYKAVKYLGIYNPRENMVYRLAVDDIPKEIIDTVETDVIGY